MTQAPLPMRVVSVNVGRALPLAAGGRRVLSGIGKRPVTGPVQVQPEETLPPGFAGENLTLDGLLEQPVWIGDELHFGQLTLRVTEPRQPCFKFAAVMGYAQATRDRLPDSRCGFCLAVVRAGTIGAGETGALVPGRRALPLVEAFVAKRGRHLR